MAYNFLKLARTLAVASLVAGTGSAWAQTSVTNTAAATIRINPFSITATYDKSSSAAVQANGVGGYSLNSSLKEQGYVNPLDALANYAGTQALSVTNAGTTNTLLGLSASGNSAVLRNTTNSLMSVANGNAQLADIYAVTDATGTFSLDISSKNADKFTRSNLISAPTGTSVGVDVSGASTYNVQQQGVAGMTATVLSPTKVELNTDAAGGGSTGQISLTSKSLSNGVQESYSTSGSAAIDGATAYVKANTTNHVALNAVNAQIAGEQSLSGLPGANTANWATFKNTDIIATTLQASYKNSDGDLVRDQKAVLASGSYVTKDSSKGATSIKIANDPADELRTIKSGSADPYSTGFAKQTTTGWAYNSTTRSWTAPGTTTLTEAAPSVVPTTGAITLPDYSTQQLTASGVAWVNEKGSSASQDRTSSALTGASGKGVASTNRGTAAVSNVVISSAAGGGGQNSITGGGFGNTVNLQTTFDMTVFGR
jgi:hypothetical protein